MNEHTIVKNDINEDSCLSCGQVGNLSEECPQPFIKPPEKTLTQKIKDKIEEVL